MFQNTGVTFMVSGNINPNLRKGFFWFLSNSLKIIWTYRDVLSYLSPCFPNSRNQKQGDGNKRTVPLPPNCQNQEQGDRYKRTVPENPKGPSPGTILCDNNRHFVKTI